MWWLIVLIVIAVLYLVILLVDFSRRKTTNSYGTSILTSNRPLLADLPLVTQPPYEVCYSAFGDPQSNLWYDPTTQRTLTSSFATTYSASDIVAKDQFNNYVYVLTANGRLSCFPH